MQEVDHLIEKFWAGKASEAEIAMLYLYFEKIQDSKWKILLEDKFEETISGNSDVLKENYSSHILKKLHEKIDYGGVCPAKRLPFSRWLKFSVAASLFLLAGLGLLKNMHGFKSPGPLAVVKPDDTKYPGMHLRLRRNSSDVPEGVFPGDGSVIQLQPGSTVSYYEPFGEQARNISLKGEAKFTIIKDTVKPFTVYASGYAITALGTAFIVSNVHPGEMVVKMLEGRVVVKATADNLKNLKDIKNIYLVAGQQLVINTQTNHSIVSLVAGRAARNNVVDSNAKKNGNVNAFTFYKTPLAQIFHRIEQDYQVKILVQPQYIAGLSFTGYFEPSDSLFTILSVICNMNNLAFTLNKEQVTIKKIKNKK